MLSGESLLTTPPLKCGLDSWRSWSAMRSGQRSQKKSSTCLLNSVPSTSCIATRRTRLFRLPFGEVFSLKGFGLHYLSLQVVQRELLVVFEQRR
eukprot:6066766-Prymnesium_polylepis.1